MSIDLVHLGTMVRLVTPDAVELLVWIELLGCGHPISVRVWISGTVSLAVTDNTASSAPAAGYMSYLIICAMVRTGPL